MRNAEALARGRRIRWIESRRHPAGILVAVPDVTKFTEWPNAPFQHFSSEHINFFTAFISEPFRQQRLPEYFYAAGGKGIEFRDC